MSKVGLRKISIPEGVKVEVTGTEVKVTGPKAEQILILKGKINVNIEGNEIAVNRLGNDKFDRSLHGLYRKLIANMIEGSLNGFTKKLDFKGVGFKAEVTGDKITLNVGFSHPVVLQAPEGIEFKVEKNVISVSGTDKQKVGQMAAEIRAIKPVEPYKGKGIKYIDEIPLKKPGKAAKVAIGTTG